MAEGFIGLSVLVSLKDPPNAKVRGLVTNVVAGELTLTKGMLSIYTESSQDIIANQELVTWLGHGSRSEMLLVPGSNVLEIEIEPDLIPPTPSTDTKPKQAFVDPAIVSYSKQNATDGHHQKSSGEIHQRTEPAVDSQTNSAEQSTPQTSTFNSTPEDSARSQQHKDESTAQPSNIQANAPASASLTAPFNDISLNGREKQIPDLESPSRNLPKQKQRQSLAPEEVADTPAPKIKGKRGGKNRRRDTTASTPTQTPISPGFDSALTNGQKRRSSNKKGWRQTPFLEESTVANTSLPRARQNSGLKNPVILSPGPAVDQDESALEPTKPSEPVKSRRQRFKEEEDPNGWATGEATDIQDMGDFDFEENHKKFDKRKVFDQIRRDDTTADEARLVSFNRVTPARPGTAGGKNLHYTENVLSPVQAAVDHSSSDSDVEISEARVSSGRSLSRASIRRKPPSRKGSALIKDSIDRTASPKLDGVPDATPNRKAFERITSPKIDKMLSLPQRKPSAGQPKPSLRTSSDRLCPCVSPLQMVEIEQLAVTELGMTEDMMTENAARGIAVRACDITMSDDSRTESTLIVILAGNHRTGSRAIAAARHLRNHGFRVILCILGLERENDQTDSVRRQLQIFRSCGGQAIKQDALVRTLRKMQLSTALIIDALLGIHFAFDDLRTDDQVVYFQLVCWANGSGAEVLALDIPSGVDASTGMFLNIHLISI